MRIVYLIHFDPPYKHAGHYCGVARNGLLRRMREHRQGKGANLVRVALKAGSKLRLARVWVDADFALEAKIKRQGGLSRKCPICKAAKAAQTTESTTCLASTA